MVGKKDKHLAAAQKLLERGQLEKALVEFQKVVEEDPKDTRVWLKMAEVQAKRGAHEEAAGIYLKTGDLYIEQGFAQKAVAVYKNVVKLTPAAVDAYIKLGSLYKQLGLMNDSAQQYEAAATLYQRLGKTKEAISAFRLAVEVQPENLASHIKLAELAAQAGMADETGRAFGKAADLLKAAGRQDEYLRVLERLLHHQPDNFARSREAAETYLARRNGRGALPKLQACLKVDPRDPTTLSMMADAYELLENKPKAVSVLKELVRLSHELGRSAERDAALKRALVLDPTEPDLQEMAGLYRLRGYVPASSASGRVIPGSPAASGARRVETKVGLHGLSGPLALSSLSPGSPPPSAAPTTTPAPVSREAARLYAETEVFAKYGLLDRAEEHARRLVANYPQHAEGRALLARILAEAGKSDDALGGGVTGELALDAPATRAEEADDGVPLPLDLSAAPLRPLHAGALSLEGDPEPGEADDAEPLDLADAEELSAEDLEEMVDEDDEGLGPTPPPVDLGDAFGAGDLPEHTLAVAPLPAPIRFGDLDSATADDISGGFGAEPSRSSSARAASVRSAEPEVSAGARRSLDAVDLPTPPPPVALPSLASRRLEDDLERTVQAPPEMLQRQRMASMGGPSPLGAVPVNPEPPRRSSSSQVGYGSGPIGSPITPPPRTAEALRPRVPLTPAELDQHADLGIAYKEMGLYDQAMSEFAMLESEPSRTVFALTMTAECLEASGRLSEAASLYKRALNSEGVTPAETVVLYYGLGRAFEGLGDTSEARYFYEKVSRRDPHFRDVAARLEALLASPEKQAR